MKYGCYFNGVMSLLQWSDIESDYFWIYIIRKVVKPLPPLPPFFASPLFKGEEEVEDRGGSRVEDNLHLPPYFHLIFHPCIPSI